MLVHHIDAASISRSARLSMIRRRIEAAAQTTNHFVAIHEFAPLHCRDALFELGYFLGSQVDITIRL